MKDIQAVNATKARNDFFNLLQRSYLEKQTFLIKKGNIPMVYIVPVNAVESQEKKQLVLLNRIKKLRNSIRQSSDSVSLLRKIRQHG